VLREVCRAIGLFGYGDDASFCDCFVIQEELYMSNSTELNQASPPDGEGAGSSEANIAKASANVPIIRIMGQEIPVTIITGIVMGLMVIALCIVSLARPDVAHSFFSIFKAGTSATYSLDKEGKLKEKHEAKVLRFWTPSVETIDVIRQSERMMKKIDKENKTNDEDQYSWYTLEEGEETLIDFGKALRGAGAPGYTRVKAIGEGSNGLKPGWIWTVSVPVGKSFDIKVLLRLYKEYFYRDRDVYIEVYD